MKRRVSVASDSVISCPYLGLRANEGKIYLEPSKEHRCYVGGHQPLIALDYQAEYCLTDCFKQCSRFISRPHSAPLPVATSNSPTRLQQLSQLLAVAMLLVALATGIALTYPWLRSFAGPVTPPSASAQTFTLPSLVATPVSSPVQLATSSILGPTDGPLPTIRPLSAVTPTPSPNPPSRAPAIPTSPGTAVASEQGQWLLSTNRGKIKGFANKISVSDGEALSLFVTSPAPTFDVEVYRMGWYNNGAQQAELVQTVRGLSARVQPEPNTDPVTGLVSALGWTSNGTLTVSGWRTGLYLLKLIASDGDQNYIPLVVRDDLKPHDFLFVHSASTDQAYNAWGGKSLYDFNSSVAVVTNGSRAAVKVSFDRPFEGDGSGASMLNWEINMVRWLEANHFDVAYSSDLDVHRDAQFDARVRAVLLVGHSEYWSKEMRDHLEAARDRGKGLGFFTGDTGSWAVRYENSTLGVNRVMVCYKLSGTDPLANSEPSLTTTRWSLPPLNRPVQQFIGIGSNASIKRSADWVVTGANSEPELFAGTDLKNGDTVPNLVGYEYDSLHSPGAGPDVPPGLQVLGRATVDSVQAPPINFDFNVTYNFDAKALPQAGRISALVKPSGDWLLYVKVVSSDGEAYIQYGPGTPGVSRERYNNVDYAIFGLGESFSRQVWAPFERDLRTDYAAGLGRAAPSDLRVSSIELRGSLAVVGPSLIDPSGTLMPIPFQNKDKPGALAWQQSGTGGEVTLQWIGPVGEQALVVQEKPRDTSPDEADSVAIRNPGAGLIVAVGTIQWSWALDDFGTRRDRENHETKVDPRIQTLTRNILQALDRSK